MGRTLAGRPTNFLDHILAKGKVVYKHSEFLL